MSHRSTMNTKFLIVALMVNQVCGTPMFIYSQPAPDHDCNQHQQSSYDTGYQNYPGPDYQGSGYQAPIYQGPGYQDTLQAMVTETLRALCDIVQRTVVASKQQIQDLTEMFLRKISANCYSGAQVSEELKNDPCQSQGGCGNLVYPQYETQGSPSKTSSPLQDRFGSEKNNTVASTHQELGESGKPQTSPVEVEAAKERTTLPTNLSSSNATTAKTTNDTANATALS